MLEKPKHIDEAGFTTNPIFAMVMSFISLVLLGGVLLYYFAHFIFEMLKQLIA